MFQKFGIFLSIFLCALTAVFSADINVRVSKEKVGINESFNVTFSSSQNIRGKPDFSPLQEDFDIISCSQAHNTSFVNGSFSQETSWNLALIAKREGNLTIPSIKFDRASSQPKTIEISSSPAPTQDDSIFLEIETSPKVAVYEQTQLIYIVRLFRSVNIAQGSLSEVKVNDPDAIIERIGKDIEFEYRHPNGTQYVVLERKFAVFPQRTGELTFSPIAFEGQIVTGRHAFFSTQSEYKRILSKMEKVLVMPIPSPFTKSNWFAANDVKLTEEWSADTNKMTIGEPITWTLTLTAAGCPGSQIPEIPLNLPSNLKHYFDKPQASNQSNSDECIGVKQIKVAIIPTKPEEIAIPEIKIQWWDLKNDKLQTTFLPARTLKVQSDQIAMNVPPTPDVINTEEATITETTHQDSQILPIWAWGLIALNAIWIGGLCYLIGKKIARKFAKPNTLQHIKAHLKKACNTNDAKQAELLLLAWYALLFPNAKARNLSEMKKHFSGPLLVAIEELYQSLYSPEKNWKGNSLWNAISAYKPAKGTKERSLNNKHVLQELYPTQE